MKIGVRYEEFELYVELTTEESKALGEVLINSVASNEINAEKFGTSFASLMDAILPLIGVETTTEEEPEENDIPEPEEEPSNKKVKIPCRTWNHRGEEAKFKFVKNWLRRRKIQFEEELGFTSSFITYELTLAQLERLQLGMKETFGEDFDTEIKI